MRKVATEVNINNIICRSGC